MKFRAFEPIDLKSAIEDFEVIELPLSFIIQDINQPRKHFDQIALNELASSIKQHGIIQPIIVKKIDEEKYQIIAGERRWRASKLAQQHSIRAIIKNNDKQQDIALALIENVQREDLNPLELAESFNRLKAEHNLSDKAIASIVGKSRPTVTNILRLLDLPEFICNLLKTGQIEMGHARALLTSSQDQQIELAQSIIDHKINVRDTEKLVQVHRISLGKKKDNTYFKEIYELKRKLSKNIGLKAELKMNAKGEGRVIIHFSTFKEANEVLDQLAETV